MTATRPTFDLDHHSCDYAKRLYEVATESRTTNPVAWSEHHGGFWVLSRYEDVARVSRDDEYFTQDNDVDGNDFDSGGGFDSGGDWGGDFGGGDFGGDF